MPAKGAGKHVAAVPAGDHPGLAGILVVHWVRAARFSEVLRGVSFTPQR
jgi:hypothetical protein